jgi:hypothetical protein
MLGSPYKRPVHAFEGCKAENALCSFDMRAHAGCKRGCSPPPALVLFSSCILSLEGVFQPRRKLRSSPPPISTRLLATPWPRSTPYGMQQVAALPSQGRCGAWAAGKASCQRQQPRAPRGSRLSVRAFGTNGTSTGLDLSKQTTSAPPAGASVPAFAGVRRRSSCLV